MIKAIFFSKPDYSKGEHLGQIVHECEVPGFIPVGYNVCIKDNGSLHKVIRVNYCIDSNSMEIHLDSKLENIYIGSS